MQRSTTPHATTAWRRILFTLAALFTGAVISVLTIELGLQIASRFTDGRESLSLDGADIRIMAVGDSHTYGALIPAEESYPAHLQTFLDQALGGRYSVVNLGLPGMSTTQVLNRLAANVDRYQPNIVIIWCGVNNKWNEREIDSRATRSPSVVDAIARSSRLVRMIRVFLHHREVDRKAESWPTHANGLRQEANRKKFDDKELIYEIDHGRGREIIIHRASPQPLDETEVEARAYQDYRAMVAWLNTSEIWTILIQYPLWVDAFGAANRAMDRAAREGDVTVVETGTAIERIPEEEIEWLWGAHPNGAMYREIARNVAAAVLARDFE